MLGKINPCRIEENNFAEIDNLFIENDPVISDVEDVFDMVSGYAECMAEAVRYLTEVEKYPVQHPAVQALKRHLAEYRHRLVQSALRNTGICPLEQ